MANIQPKNIIYRLIFETKDAVRAIKGVDTETKKLKSTTDNLQKSEKENQKAFVTAANKREQLIKEERQDLIELRKRRAQAYSVREIREYNNRIKETTQRIETLKGSTGKASKQFDLMGGVIGKLGGVLATTFAVERIGAFVAESVKLANQTRNVRNAFNQLSGATTILNQLRLATGNTVDDLTLMQAAVRADKFKIPLQQLASFFKFAADRAAETGQSVDYLVDSIVDGIGRKSSLVLDNLGISAVEIQEEFKKTGDFGQAAANIIEREMGKANVQVDEGARASARFSTALTNLKTSIGNLLVDAGINDFVGGLAAITQGFADAADGSKESTFSLGAYLGALAAGGPALANYLSGLEDVVRTAEAFSEANNDFQRALKSNDASLIIDYISKLVLLKETAGDSAALIAELDEKIRQLNVALSEIGKEDVALERNLFFLNEEIRKLTEEQNSAATSVARVKAIEGELNELYKERDLLLGKVNDKTNSYKKTIGDLADELDRELKETPLTSGFEQYYDDLDEAERITRQFNADLRKAIEEGNAQDEAIIRKELEEWEAKEKEKTDIAKREIEAREQIQRATVDTFITLANSFFEYQNALYNQDLNNLQSQLDNKTITEQQFYAKQKQIKRDQAQAAKNAATFEAIINTAVAVTENLAVPVLAALAAVQGAAQVALIQAQPIPQFAEGVIGIKGPGTETSDSIPAMLSKGESVMTAKETRKHKDVFEAIRANSFDEFARKNYIEPALLNYTIKDGRERKKQEQAYNDYRLVRAVKGNGNVGVKNADDIGRSVAKHLSHRDWISKKFR